MQSELEKQQLHLGMISLNFNTNQVGTPAEAERYDKGIIRRIKTVSGRLVSILEELRERNQTVKIANLTHWHPVVQVTFAAKLRASKYPLISQLGQGVKPIFTKHPKLPPHNRRF